LKTTLSFESASISYTEPVKKLVVEYWLPIIVWLIAMFVFSTDMMSSSETSRFIVPILRFLFPGLSPAGITFWHGVIRKLAHVTEYFILATFVYRALKFERPDLVDATMRAIVFVALAALLDEFHQSFVPSRTASIVDVGYDCLGAVWALWVIAAYEFRRLRPHSVL
jgi:VanZ family protein